MSLTQHSGLPDLHVHSQFSCDGRSSMEELCRQAIALGLRWVAFTDHVDLEPRDVCAGFFQPAAYFAEVQRCRTLFSDRLTILSGVEVGEVHRYGPEVAALLGQYSFDVMLGSLHWVDGYQVFDRAYFETRSCDQAYREYLVELECMCRHGGFDVLGHLDVLKRAGARTPDAFSIEPYESEVRAVLRTLVDKGIALEINTSPLRRPVNQTSPTQSVIEWYRQLGGELLTLGSDAHSADQLAAGLVTAAEVARSAGFRYVAVYESHQPHFYPLEAVR